MIEKQYIMDAEKKPIAVVLSYLDWLKIEHLVEPALGAPSKELRKKRVSGLGMGKGVVIPDDFNDELPDDFWLNENDIL